MEEHAKKVAELLKLMANENRLLILCSLTKGSKTVSEICEVVPKISQPGLSQHLQLMRTAGILSSEKKAQNVTYSISDNRINKLMETLEENYCVNDELI
ncbi:MAG: metalloregulator ArsR/SmtB family transcription factor [Coriobacteriales bacterium]|nr:metalloregulator ArsR/SmtB family transcription factor [Coriobacteriales bacterium]